MWVEDYEDIHREKQNANGEMLQEIQVLGLWREYVVKAD